MTTRAFAIVAVRILGLVALFRGAIAGVSMLMFLLRPETFRGTYGTSAWSAVLTSVLGGALLPVIAGILCLACTRPIADFLAKGTEGNP
ncbi:MAG: hypothetical protein GX595_01240 [Lentisphaerae bacterium]|nr:hypothetical protein [Lentisphaerota bacterium]